MLFRISEDHNNSHLLITAYILDIVLFVLNDRPFPPQNDTMRHMIRLFPLLKIAGKNLYRVILLVTK